MNKIAGFSSLGMGLIYVIAFVIYGAVLQFPSGADEEIILFLKDNFGLLYTMNVLMYVLFGVLLSVLVVGINHHLETNSPNISRITKVFGFIWVGLVIAAGMIGNIALSTVTSMSDTQQAMEIWRTIQIVTEGLGGGNEVVGGLWVFLLTVAGFKSARFPKHVSIFGLIVGTAGIATIFPLEIFTIVFGLSQILWFIAIGVFLIRLEDMDEVVHS